MRARWRRLRAFREEIDRKGEARSTIRQRDEGKPRIADGGRAANEFRRERFDAPCTGIHEENAPFVPAGGLVRTRLDECIGDTAHRKPFSPTDLGISELRKCLVELGRRWVAPCLKTDERAARVLIVDAASVVVMGPLDARAADVTVVGDAPEI